MRKPRIVRASVSECKKHLWLLADEYAKHSSIIGNRVHIYIYWMFYAHVNWMQNKKKKLNANIFNRNCTLHRRRWISLHWKSAVAAKKMLVEFHGKCTQSVNWARTDKISNAIIMAQFSTHPSRNKIPISSFTNTHTRSIGSPGHRRSSSTGRNE